MIKLRLKNNLSKIKPIFEKIYTSYLKIKWNDNEQKERVEENIENYEIGPKRITDTDDTIRNLNLFTDGVYFHLQSDSLKNGW